MITIDKALESYSVWEAEQREKEDKLKCYTLPAYDINPQPNWPTKDLFENGLYLVRMENNMWSMDGWGFDEGFRPSVISLPEYTYPRLIDGVWKAQTVEASQFPKFARK